MDAFRPLDSWSTSAYFRLRLKMEPPIDIRLSRNHGSTNDRSKKFEYPPRWNWTPIVSPRPRKFRVENENCPKIPSSSRVPRTELDFVPVRVDPLDRDVDGLLVRVDLELGVLLDLEVAELGDLEEPLLERLHVQDVALEELELAAQDLVLRRLVPDELDAPDPELVSLRHADRDVDDVSLARALDVLGVHEGVDVAPAPGQISSSVFIPSVRMARLRGLPASQGKNRRSRSGGNTVVPSTFNSPK